MAKDRTAPNFRTVHLTCSPDGWGVMNNKTGELLTSNGRPLKLAKTDAEARAELESSKASKNRREKVNG